MTYTERMLIILNAIFGRDLDGAFLRSVMLAFAEGVPLDNMTETEIAEAICRQWIESARTEMLDTVRAYNRMIAVVQADAATNEQLQALNS